MNNSNQMKLDKYYQSIRNHKQTDLAKMKDEAEELLRYAYQSDEVYGQAFAFFHLALYDMDLRKYEAAQYNLKKVETICLQEGFSSLLLLCYRYEGTIFQIIGDKIKAIRLYGKAMDLADKQKKDDVMGILYNNIAILLMDYKDLKLAKEYFERAVAKFIKLPKQTYNLVQVYANLIQIGCALANIPMANDYLKKAEAIQFTNDKAFSTLLASKIRLYAQKRDLISIVRAYEDYMRFLNCSNVNETSIAADMLVIAESLLLVDLKENCQKTLYTLEKLLEHSNLELELQFYKLYIKYQETYGEDNPQIYEKYYSLLIQSEDNEYRSLAESLRGRIELSERNQMQSRLEKENESLQKQVHFDEMTGAYNRRYFDKLLSKLKSDKHVQKIGCIMLDVDCFKEYNDSYGHLQGDVILKQIVEILIQHSFEGIYVGRFGGDEFYCICANLTDHQIEVYLRNVYEDLFTRRIEHRMKPDKVVTLSAGFCNELNLGIDLHDVLECADKALYSAKEKGRGMFLKYEKE